MIKFTDCKPAIFFHIIDERRTAFFQLFHLSPIHTMQLKNLIKMKEFCFHCKGNYTALKK